MEKRFFLDVKRNLRVCSKGYIYEGFRDGAVIINIDRQIKGVHIFQNDSENAFDRLKSQE